MIFMVFNAIICYFIAISIEKHINLIPGVYIGAVTVQLIKFGIVALGIPGQLNNAAIALCLLISYTASKRGEISERWRLARKRAVRQGADL